MENITEYLIQSTVSKSEVRAWAEEVMLPTYEIGNEEKNPIFLEKRVYQGSSGSVYPYPVVEKIEDKKVDKKYHALFIENEYIKIMVLPELGGRVQMAYDKVKKRHFVYYNQVIKPALVGLTGPWISGGIEFNWPQHHRPSTYLPTDSMIEENEDGSKTIWCNEVERMFRMKGMQGFTLYPGKAYLEIKVKVYNRTAFPQTFLWWANPAVVVNDHYRSVFPPDVNAVFDHGKRDVSNFPIATGVYYKQDYSAGVDISMYKNIPVPTSYMAIRSKYDFVGGYEEDVKGGLLHVANHHVSPGKKQWTWGNGDFGKAWDRNLTDEDGPYIELMTGVYTDNQPDFTWLQPYEEKSWTQYFMPYSEVGYVKNATKEALVNLEVANDNAKLVLYTTSVYPNTRILLKTLTGEILLDRIVQATPLAPFTAEVETGDLTVEQLIVSVYDEKSNLLVEYKAEEPKIQPIPDPAKAALLPEEIKSVEQLYLTGLHLEQYRHATYSPLDYYKEALKREPGDVRCNNAVGLYYMRKGQFAVAEPYFQRAVDTLTERNPNPYDGEPYYNLGWSLKMQDKLNEAYDAFYKSAWNAAWQDAAYFSVAQIDTVKGNYVAALDAVERSLTRNWCNHKARQLKCSILRKMGNKEEAIRFADDSLQMDPFNMGCLFEKYLSTGDGNVLARMKELMRGWCHGYIEYSLDFAAAGLYKEAVELLMTYKSSVTDCYPMIEYTLSYLFSCLGDEDKALAHCKSAELCKADYCFPNRIEEVKILKNAIRINPQGANAYYYLGNFWYAARQYAEAIDCWEKSSKANPEFPTIWRNLALAYFNKHNDRDKALEALERAFDLDKTDARILMELDQFYKRLGYPYQKRLEFLEKHLDLVEGRDDLYLERVTLYNQLGDFAKAKELISLRSFHPWEGGEGKVTKQYILCRLSLAKQALKVEKYEEALALLKEATVYPYNLGEGKLAGAEENDIYYYMGAAYQGLGDIEQASRCFKLARIGSCEPQQAFFYNDQQPDKIFYQGLALRHLGREEEARGRFNRLIEFGEKHLFDSFKMDYFAVSLPDLQIWEDDMDKKNRIHCNYLMALGHLGLGNIEKAETYFALAAEMDNNHQGVQIHRKMIL